MSIIIIIIVIVTVIVNILIITVNVIIICWPIYNYILKVSILHTVFTRTIRTSNNSRCSFLA